MASRRRSLAPQALASNIPAPTIQKRTSRRASMAVIPEPPKVQEKRGRGRRPASIKTEIPETIKTEEKQIESAKSNKDDSFVSADTFDFIAMESPKGPMTRSRRSSMFVGSKAKRGGGMFLPMLPKLHESLEKLEFSFMQLCQSLQLDENLK